MTHTETDPPTELGGPPAVTRGTEVDGVVHAHAGLSVGAVPPSDRLAREAAQDAWMAPGATRAEGAGSRERLEEPDAIRTCFERDLDRIQHSAPFRRLAGKCQVFVAPEDDHLRTRLTHAIEVAQVAVSIARGTRLNEALTTAAALGHDCGHGPGGHASEDALGDFLDRGYDHAVYGADVTLTPLNLCWETLDAVRNHSWKRPAPATPEAEVVAWADRIAYVCHDWQDAVRAGIVTAADLPSDVADVIGTDKSGQLGGFIRAMTETIIETGQVGMRRTEAEALAAFRRFNFANIYMRPASLVQAEKVGRVVRGVVESYIDRPEDRPNATGPSTVPGSLEAVEAAVHYVSGMTDRFLLKQAVDRLGWREADLPRGV